MAERFAGKVAIVTGGASGIGAAIVDRLAGEGARVVCADRSSPAVLRADVLFHPADFMQREEVEAMVGALFDAHGRVDFLVNNAGIGALAEVQDQDDAGWARIFAVNVNAVMYGCRAAIPAMQRQGGGAIVNVASISGLSGDYGMGAYNATKGAVVNYTRSVAIDWARDGIRVNALCPA